MNNKYIYIYIYLKVIYLKKNKYTKKRIQQWICIQAGTSMDPHSRQESDGAQFGVG